MRQRGGEMETPWVQLQGECTDSGSGQRFFRLGNEKLREALSRCPIYDIKVGNRVFERCFVTILTTEEYFDRALAKSPDGFELNLKGGECLRACQEIHDANEKERKEKINRVNLERLGELKRRIDKKLAQLQSPNIAKWHDEEIKHIEASWWNLFGPNKLTFEINGKSVE